MKSWLVFHVFAPDTGLYITRAFFIADIKYKHTIAKLKPGKNLINQNYVINLIRDL